MRNPKAQMVAVLIVLWACLLSPACRGAELTPAEWAWLQLQLEQEQEQAAADHVAQSSAKVALPASLPIVDATLTPTHKAPSVLTEDSLPADAQANSGSPLDYSPLGDPMIPEDWVRPVYETEHLRLFRHSDGDRVVYYATGRGPFDGRNTTPRMMVGSATVCTNPAKPTEWYIESAGMADAFMDEFIEGVESSYRQEQPTPWPGVAAMIAASEPAPGDVFWDPGCGRECRILIRLCEEHEDVTAVGVEIDPNAADAARREVEAHGLEDRIDIFTGDSRTVDVKANKAVAYNFPELLTELRAKFSKMDRVVTYGFKVPNVRMEARAVANGGTIYVWDRQPATVQVPVYRSVRVPGYVRLPQGSTCYCNRGRNCPNPMAHKYAKELAGYRTVPAAAASEPGATVPRTAAAPREGGHWATQCTFNRWGRKTGCHRVFVPN